MQVFEKYKQRGVSFVSFTTESKQSVASFVERWQISWPAAYGASTEMIDALGAFQTEMMIPGYEIRPTLYVIGDDGRVRWRDDNLRSRHQDSQSICTALENAIEEALKTKR